MKNNPCVEEFYANFNNTKVEYEKEQTIMNLFMEQAQKTPHADAIVFQEKILSYQELDERSNQVAHFLKKRNIGANDIVGISLDRSFEMVIGLFGILKCGAAYIPILPNTPLSRMGYIIKDSNMKCLLTQTKYVKSLLSLEVELIDLEHSEVYLEEKSRLDLIMDPHDLMYVIYTSGSTGQPKGVMIENYSVVNRLLWMQKKYSIGVGDTILQKTPFAFDVSVWELFWWSITGARVCMLEAGYEKFPQSIIMEIQRSSVTTIHFVPSMLGVLLHYIEDGEEIQQMKSLKQVFCSGEVLMPTHVNKFNSLIGKPYGTKLVNLYGPTEATVDVSYYNCPRDEEVCRVPIGKPIDNTCLYVMQNGVLVGPGEEGELFIGGDGLARGYLNQEELTNEKYKVYPNVFHNRLYQTGDYVRLTKDGYIEFIGRLDYQVKLRGLRIELGEIEKCLNQYKNIEQSVVVVENEDKPNAGLVAYILSAGEVEKKELRKYLSMHLPDYMIPSKFEQVNEFPLNQNGKLDRKALKKIGNR